MPKLDNWNSPTAEELCRDYDRFVQEVYNQPYPMDTPILMTQETIDSYMSICVFGQEIGRISSWAPSLIEYESVYEIGADPVSINTEEDDHEGMIYNAITDTWSWL